MTDLFRQSEYVLSLGGYEDVNDAVDRGGCSGAQHHRSYGEYRLMILPCHLRAGTSMKPACANPYPQTHPPEIVLGLLFTPYI